MSSSETKPGFFRRLWRAFLKLLIFVLVIAILIGLGVGGFIFFEDQITAAVQDAQPWEDNQTERINTNSERLFEIQNDLTRLQGAEVPDFGADISDVEAGVDSIADRVAALEESLAAAEAANAEMSAALETAVSNSSAEMATAQEALASASALGETALEDVSTIQETLLVLQSDINDNSERIDGIGGEVDLINNSLVSLDATLTEGLSSLDTVVASAESAETLRDGTLRQSLALFRVWQLVTRARVHLVENNVGLAILDVQSAIDSVDLLTANSSDPALIEQLETVQARLALALLNLPDGAQTAAGDLESAWEALDTTLTSIIIPLVEAEATAGEAEVPAEGEEGETTDGEDAEPADDEEAVATPEPTGTPEEDDAAAEGTPTPEPTDEADEEEGTPTPTPTPGG